MGCFDSASSERNFLMRLSNELSKRGVTDVLRKGYKYITETFDMYYSTPSELNPSAQEMYSRNIFCVTRQLFYSTSNNNSIDLYISLNGLPVMTIELKNHYTHQTVDTRRREKGRNASKKSPATDMTVRFPDGTLIAEKSAADTLEKVVRRIGVDNVRHVVEQLNLKICKVPVISNRRDEKYGKSQRSLGGGWLLITHSNNRMKRNHDTNTWRNKNSPEPQEKAYFGGIFYFSYEDRIYLPY